MSQYKASGIDQKIVVASVLSFLKTAKDYSTHFRSDVVSDINAKHTSTAVVRLEPTVELADMPAERDGLLPRTGASSTHVEVQLSSDKYAKVAVDTLDIEPEKQAAELGTAIAKAMVREGNANLIAGLVAGGVGQNLGEDFTEGTTGQTVWSSLIKLVTPFAEGEYTEDLVLFIKPTVWARLMEDVASLRTSVKPQEQAALLLGVAAVEVAPIAGALAVAAHRSTAVQARRFTPTEQGQEDFDQVVRSRIKLGTKVLVPAGVQVLKDGVEG